MCDALPPNVIVCSVRGVPTSLDTEAVMYMFSLPIYMSTTGWMCEVRNEVLQFTYDDLVGYMTAGIARHAVHGHN